MLVSRIRRASCTQTQNLPKHQPRFQTLCKTTNAVQKLRLRLQVRTLYHQTPFGWRLDLAGHPLDKPFRQSTGRAISFPGCFIHPPQIFLSWGDERACELESTVMITQNFFFVLFFSSLLQNCQRGQPKLLQLCRIEQNASSLEREKEKKAKCKAL